MRKWLDDKSKVDRALILLGIIFAYLLAMSVVGCKSQIKLVETHSVDTIFKTEIIKITEPVFNEVFIESPCDSLGNLKPINIVSNNSKAKVSLKSVKNDLILTVDIDSIVDSRVEEFKASFKSEKKETTVIKYKNKKLMWYSLSLNLLLLAWIFKSPALKLLKWF